MVNRTRLRRLGARAAIFVAAVCLFVPAAGRAAPAASSAQDTPVYGGTLVIANQTDADSLDPAGNPVNEIIWADQNVYERLVQASADGNSILPDLASSWTISKDALTYVFHLRNAKFQNGAPVTAADVVYSLDRAVPYPNGWGFLINSVKTITATDAKTVTMTLKHPWAPLLADLAIYAMAIMPADLLKKEGKAFFNHPIGSGPYQIVSWQKGSTITLQRNPYWWGPKPYLDTVKLVNVPNDNTRVLQLQGKQADIIENPPSNLLKQIASYPGLVVNLFPSTRVDFLQVDEHFAPFKDVKVRQAINYGIDRNAIVKIALGGHGTPAGSPMPPMLYWDPNIKPYPYNPAKAKALLAQSSYPHGFKTNLIEVSGDLYGNATAVIIKSELASIGIDVTIQDYELTTAYAKEDERPGNPTSNLGQRYWTNDIVDPQEMVSFLAEPNAGANDMGTWYNNPVLNQLAKQAEVELDAA
ncbi:MAG TPA: ABC transporter substrate-binding protein, partial [Chloroflexota bacterium]|nr:ABC transporter substrate-binding protein [Chloroflexota bacterium]